MAVSAFLISGDHRQSPEPVFILTDGGGLSLPLDAHAVTTPYLHTTRKPNGAVCHESLQSRRSKIKPAAYNPRKALTPKDDEYQAIKRSIEAFGLVEPLVWNKLASNLVGGHQRLRVLKDLGHKEVDVSEVDLDPRQERALNVALNKSAAL